MSGGTSNDGGSAAVPTEDRSPVRRAIALRWKHALVAVLLGGTTYALYEVGGWSLDTVVFGLVTLAVVGYSVVTYRSDAR